MLPLLLLSCLQEAPVALSDDGCEPLIGEICALPFPSTALMTPDPTTDSGWRVSIPADGLPVDIDGAVTAPDAWNTRDGFSTWGPLVFWLPDLGAVPGHDTLGAHLDADAPVVVLDVETGQRLPVWVERDLAANDPEQQSAIIRLAAPMRHGTRHIVAIRGLTDAAGDLLPGLAVPESRADHYDAEIFPVLEAAGIDTAALQLSWDFVTHSQASVFRQASALQDRSAAHPAPAHTIEEVEEADCSEPGVTIGRTVHGTVSAPDFLAEDDVLLSVDEDGLPAVQGEVLVDFIAQIPCSLLAAPEPSLTIQFGHGLLGSRDESTQAYLGELLDEAGAVMIASDWRGMSKSDRGDITLMMAEDLGRFSTIPERTLQGFVELDAVMRHLQEGGFDAEPALSVDGMPLIDAEQTAFYGISQGGILGVGYLGFSDRLDRGAVSVPGGPFTTLMPRSVHFEAFRLILEARYPDARDIAVMMAAIQSLWEPAEGGGWVSTMDDDVLIQTALGDSQVSATTAHNLARALGAHSVAPAVRPIWGVEETGGEVGSAIAEWRYLDGGEDPVEAVPADTDGDTHTCVRREPLAQAQLLDFLRDGVVAQHCDGVCEGVRAGVCD